MNAQQHRKHLAKTSARRKKVRAAAVLKELPTASPARAKQREVAREKFEVGISKTPSRARKPAAKKKAAKKLRVDRFKPLRGPAPVKARVTRKKPNAAKQRAA